MSKIVNIDAIASFFETPCIIFVYFSKEELESKAPDIVEIGIDLKEFYKSGTVRIEMDVFGLFPFHLFIVRELLISFRFFQSFNTNMILFILKNIIHFLCISFVFSVKDRSVNLLFSKIFCLINLLV